MADAAPLTPAQVAIMQHNAILAAILTAGVVANDLDDQGKHQQVTASGSDLGPQARAQNVHAWEAFKVFTNALNQLFPFNSVAFPPPPAPPAGSVAGTPGAAPASAGDPLAALKAALSGVGVAAPITNAGQLLALLQPIANAAGALK